MYVIRKRLLPSCREGTLRKVPGRDIYISICCDIIRLPLERQTPPTSNLDQYTETLILCYKSISLNKPFPHQAPNNMPGRDLFETCPPPGSMHSDCRTCEQHFLIEEAQPPYVTRKFVALDDEMAERWLFKTLGETKEHLHHVKGMISSHGDVILSRWKKFSQAKRAKLLNTAAPEILLSPLCEPADYITSLDPKIEVGHAAIPGRETNGFGHDYMKLLSLLHVRSEYDPSQWAAFDTRSTQSLCSQSTWKQYLYNPRAVIMHGEQYGRLVDFDVNAAHGWQQAGFPRAILTLIVQQMIAETLSKAVCAIVADAEPTGHDKWTAMVSKGLRSAHQEALWSSYYHQEFTLPAQFEVDAILEKIRMSEHSYRRDRAHADRSRLHAPMHSRSQSANFRSV